MNREALSEENGQRCRNVSTAVFYGISGIVFDDSYRNPAAPFLAPQTGAGTGLRPNRDRRWYPLFCKCLYAVLLLMAVTAGGWSEGYALAGREELAAWG